LYNRKLHRRHTEGSHRDGTPDAERLLQTPGNVVDGYITFSDHPVDFSDSTPRIRLPSSKVSAKITSGYEPSGGLRHWWGHQRHWGCNAPGYTAATNAASWVTNFILLSNQLCRLGRGQAHTTTPPALRNLMGDNGPEQPQLSQHRDQ